MNKMPNRPLQLRVEMRVIGDVPNTKTRLRMKPVVVPKDDRAGPRRRAVTESGKKSSVSLRRHIESGS